MFTAPVENRMTAPKPSPGPGGEKPAPPAKEPEAEQIESDAVKSAFREKPLRIIGTVFDTYILLEYDDRLLLCDQHAVHERLLYEKLMNEPRGTPPIQGL